MLKWYSKMMSNARVSGVVTAVLGIGLLVVGIGAYLAFLQDRGTLGQEERQGEVMEHEYPLIYPFLSKEQQVAALKAFYAKNPEYDTEDCRISVCITIDPFGFNQHINVPVSPHEGRSRALTEGQIEEIKRFILANKEYFGVQEESELGQIILREKQYFGIQEESQYIYHYAYRFSGPRRLLDFDLVRTGQDADVAVVSLLITRYEYDYKPNAVTVGFHFWPSIPNRKLVKDAATILDSLEGKEYTTVSGCESADVRQPCNPLITLHRIAAEQVRAIKQANPNPELVMGVATNEDGQKEVRYVYYINQGEIRLYVDAVDGTILAVPGGRLMKGISSSGSGGQALSPTVSPPRDTTGWKAYRNEAGKYEVQYPPSLKLKGEDRTTGFFVTSGINEGEIENGIPRNEVMVMVGGPSGAPIDERAYNNPSAFLEFLLGSASRIEVQELVIDGYAAKRAVAESVQQLQNYDEGGQLYTSLEKSYNVLYTIRREAGSYYSVVMTMSGSSDASAKDAWTRIFDQMVSTMKFIR